MKTIGTAFAILTGGLMITGMFIAGVVCGAGIMIEKEKREKTCYGVHHVSYRDHYEKRKNDEEKSES